MRVNNRSPFKPRPRGDYRVENKTDEATIYLYDEIGWFGIKSEQFIKDLNALTAKTVHIRVNSPGGDVFDGTAIFNAIKQHKARTVVHIDGLAASIASVIALAGSEVLMSENAFLMIHDPWSIVIGNADAMRDEAELLDKVGGTIAKVYMDKSGKRAEEINELMASETWMTGQEAMDMGFIDGLDKKAEEKDSKAKALFDLSVFANVPDQLREKKHVPTERDIERILRDAGCPIKMAKAILAGGYQKGLRDAGPEEAAPPEPAKVAPQRDVEPAPVNAKKDRVKELLIRAELAAPSTP